MKSESALIDPQTDQPRDLVKPAGKFTLSNIGPWSWFVIDYAIAYVCAALAFWLTPHSVDIQNDTVTGEHIGQMAFCFGFGLCLALIAHIAGLHERNQKRTSLKLFGLCALISFAAILVLTVELLLVHYLVVGRLITIITFLSAALGLFVVRALVVGMADQHVVGFVGSQNFVEQAPSVDSLLIAQGVRTVSLVMDEKESISLRNWAMRNGVDQVVVDPEDQLAPNEAELLGLLNSNINVSTYTNFVEKLFQRIPNEHINAKWVIDCQADHTVVYNSAVKRALDIVVASIALVLLLPVFLIAMVCVRFDSPGPIIFKQTRVGQFGKLFTMFKIRTMVQHAEQDGAQWATLSDNRVTKVGQFLRKSRIDEIPQLVNVLMGDMSLVGPRPERPEFTKELESRIPYFVHRVLVKPGITGWAQVNAGYAASEAEAATKLSFDLYYVKNMSFGLDLRVLLRTISSFAAGAR
jgi:exopolysaccharide biosynthesis polyprenyl glycosylphosphotransferase